MAERKDSIACILSIGIGNWIKRLWDLASIFSILINYILLFYVRYIYSEVYSNHICKNVRKRIQLTQLLFSDPCYSKLMKDSN